MLEEKIKVTLKIGLHARPSSALVNLLRNMQLDKALLSSDSETINALSIMDVMALGVTSGSIVTFKASGPDAGKALEAVRNFLDPKSLLEKELDILLRNIVIKALESGKNITPKSPLEEIEDTRNDLEKDIENIKKWVDKIDQRLDGIL